MANTSANNSALVQCTFRRITLFVCTLSAALAATACDTGSTRALDARQMDAYAALLMPARIEIQPWTRLEDRAGAAQPTAIEALLAAYDAFDDETKAVGTVHFELYARRRASADRLGERVAFWEIALDSAPALQRFWDRSMRFYRFRLELPSGPLDPGRYILIARLIRPDGKRLEHEFELRYGDGPLP